MHELAQAGQLSDEARWISRTRLPGSVVSRPIRIGDVLRSSMSKRVIREANARMRPRLMESHQWGVALPGAAEALVHWRSTVEEMARRGDISALVAFDLDLQNMFGSIEWPKIRAAIAAHLPEAAAWTDWAHRESAVVQLPDGTEYRVNRGAEQGDPFGSAEASLTLGDAMDVARPVFAEATSVQRASGGVGAVDE